jgi:hypothetical protein
MGAPMQCGVPGPSRLGETWSNRRTTHQKGNLQEKRKITGRGNGSELSYVVGFDRLLLLMLRDSRSGQVFRETE